MKSVLVASFYFPPYAAVSGVRATKFCKYLPQFDWEPTVLTVDERYYGENVIRPMPQEIDDIRVKRYPYLPVPGRFTLIKLLFPFLFLWTVSVRRRKVDAVMLIGSPYHPFLITPLLRLAGIASVLDFRDSWSLNPYSDERSDSVFSKTKKALRSLIERIAIRHASAVTFASDELNQEYSRAFPQWRHKYVTVYNGFDPEDFQNVTPRRISASKSIILTGKFHFYTPKLVRDFFEALAEQEALCFIYVGAEHETIRRIADRSGINAQVICLPQRPYAEVLQLIAGSDFGMMTNHLRNGIGTKIFDYLALGKATLCFVPTESTIRHEFGGNPLVHIREEPHTKAVIRDGLSALLSSSATVDHENAIQRFSRKQSTSVLASTLDSLA